eukprot:1133677-Alexandrium_andersonii.AAC.1
MTWRRRLPRIELASPKQSGNVGSLIGRRLFGLRLKKWLEGKGGAVGARKHSDCLETPRLGRWEFFAMDREMLSLSSKPSARSKNSIRNFSTAP